MSKERIKQFTFLVLFVIIGFCAMQVPFSQIIGTSVKFNLFDFYGPIVGGFVGSIWGLITVSIMQLTNWAWHGFTIDTSTIIRFFPMLFSVLYFARKSRLMLVVPAMCIIAFWMHPEGHKAWLYPLYWLIPIAMYFLHDKFIFARALGATFTAHSVGSVLFLWIFNLPATVWKGLLPIVWKERGLMAIGIMLTFLLFNFILRTIAEKTNLKLPFLKLQPKLNLNTK